MLASEGVHGEMQRVPGRPVQHYSLRQWLRCLPYPTVACRISLPLTRGRYQTGTPATSACSVECFFKRPRQLYFKISSPCSRNYRGIGGQFLLQLVKTREVEGRNLRYARLTTISWHLNTTRTHQRPYTFLIRRHNSESTLSGRLQISGDIQSLTKIRHAQAHVQVRARSWSNVTQEPPLDRGTALNILGNAILA